MPVLLGLGANLGDPAAQLERAVRMLGSAVRVERISSLYRTEPVGHADQPDFLNLVLAGETRLEPEALLRALHEVEAALGRQRPFADGPRTIDVDLLAYGDCVRAAPELVVPHPRLHLRGFVLYPLAEIAPEWRHPVLDRTARELLSQARSLERVERVGPLRPFPAPLAPGHPPG